MPTLEQLGLGVRMWSDAIGITGESETFSGQDRHLLSNSTVFGLARDLASMNHAQKVNAYCDLIRFLGVLYADLMRAMLRAEEIVDEEVLLQVTAEVATEVIVPTMAPHLARAAAGKHVDENEVAAREDTEMEECADLEAIENVSETDMVDGWLEADGREATREGGADYVSHMQVAARVGPTTAFASYLARLQAHFESMTKEQIANVIHFLYGKLEAWREEWVMALTSVSRDRADRLWALLVTYQGDPTCILDKDKQWAEARWREVVDMLQIDAVRAMDVGAFRLPDKSGVVSVLDAQKEPASSSDDVLVQRQPGGRWEAATDREKEELASHDAAVEEEAALQAEHDAHLWANHQAAEQAERAGPHETRPLKKFKVRVTVTDSDHNELAVADLAGEVAVNDVPQVNLVVQEQVVQAMVEAEGDAVEATDEGNARAGDQRDAEEARDGPGAPDEGGQTETEAVASPAMAGAAQLDMQDVEVDGDLTDLGAILETVMGRQWFQLYVQKEVDDDMVRRRWGASVLEVFQVNRDMMELADEKAREKALKEARACPDVCHESEDVNVDRMSDSGGSSAFSGAKVLKREILAGRRGRAGERQAAERDLLEVEAEPAGRLASCATTAPAEGGHGAGTAMCGETAVNASAEDSQQVLQDTQLEQMDVEGEAEIAAAGASGTTSTPESMRADSYGDGNVQSSLHGWLK